MEFSEVMCTNCPEVENCPYGRHGGNVICKLQTEVFPCPFCGGKPQFNIEHLLYSEGTGEFVNISCQKCNARTASDEILSRVVREWNNRSGGSKW